MKARGSGVVRRERREVESLGLGGRREGAGGRVLSLVGADVPAARPEVGPYLADTHLSPVFMQKEVRLSRFQSESCGRSDSC